MSIERKNPWLKERKRVPLRKPSFTFMEKIMNPLGEGAVNAIPPRMDVIEQSINFYCAMLNAYIQWNGSGIIAFDEIKHF